MLQASGYGAHAQSARPSVDVTHLLEYVLAFLIIVSSGTVWQSVYAIFALQITRPALVGVALVIFLIRLRNHAGMRWSVYEIIWLCACGLCFALCLFNPSASLSSSVLIFSVLIAASLYAGVAKSTDDAKSLFVKLSNVLVVFALASLPFYVFGSLLGIVSGSESVTYDWDGERQAVSYYGLYFDSSWQKVNFLGVYYGSRNCGIFAEAPMYAFVLCTCLAFQTLIEKRFDWKSVVLVLTIISTLSTTAYIVLIILVAYYFVAYRGRNEFLRRIKIVILPALIVVAAIGVAYVFVSRTSSESYGIRSEHLVTTIRLFFDYFPGGIGVGNADGVRSFFSNDQGVSIGIPYFLAMGGLPALCVVGVPFGYALITSVKARSVSLFVFVLIFFWLFFTTNVVFNSALQWFVLVVVLLRYASCVRQGG